MCQDLDRDSSWQYDNNNAAIVKIRPQALGNFPPLKALKWT